MDKPDRAGPVLVRPGILRQFELWLGQPAWFRNGTACAGSTDPLPELIPLADEVTMIGNIFAHGGAETILERVAATPMPPLPGPILAALAAAPTPGAAFGLLIELTNRANPHLWVQLDEAPDGGGVASVRCQIEGGAGAFVEALVALILVRQTEALAYDRFAEVRLVLPGPHREMLGGCLAGLRCHVDGGAGVALQLPTGSLDTPNAFADPVVWRLSADQARARNRWGHSEPVTRLHTLVARMLRDERTVLRRQDAARRMGMADRTLSRMLAAAGTGYAELVENERRAFASELLADPSLSLQQIADRLGFPDPSSFGRTFRRWHGMTPGQFRQLQGS